MVSMYALAIRIVDSLDNFWLREYDGIVARSVSNAALIVCTLERSRAFASIRRARDMFLLYLVVVVAAAVAVVVAAAEDAARATATVQVVVAAA